jgi:hypothetical protein
MKTFDFKVPVEAETLGNAADALESRLWYAQDIGFPYKIGVGTFIQDAAKEAIKEVKAQPVQLANASAKRGGWGFKKTLLAVGLTYWLAQKARPYYQTYRFVKENPNHPRAIAAKSNFQKARESVRNFMDEVKSAWKRSAVTQQFDDIVKENNLGKE